MPVPAVFPAATMAQHANKRRFERHALSVQFNVERKPPYNGTPLPALMMEIAEGGFSAMVSDALQIGETVAAKIPLAGSEAVFVEAVVRNKNTFRYGFEFVGLPEEVRNKISEACRSLPVYGGGWH